jgi:hypothetical protein
MITYTFVADSPDHDNKDAALAAVREVLAKTTSKVAPVASIQELWDELHKLRNAADANLIQIIGHSTAGRMLLGRIATAVDSDAHYDYVLDSNPYRYGTLLGQLPSNAKVWLLGCHLGDNGNHVSDGPTLLFDLARLWSTDVCGPVALVNPQDFDTVTGIYKYPNRLCVAKNLSVTMPPPPPPMARARAAPVGNLKITKLPHLGALETPQRIERAGNVFTAKAKVFADLFSSAIRTDLLLAAPEIEFTSTDGPVALIANGTILRVTSATGVRHLVTDGTGASANAAARIVREVMRAALSRSTGLQERAHQVCHARPTARAS